MKNLVCAALMLASIWAHGAGPELTFDQTTVNAGAVDPDTRIEAVFRFTNTGDDTLQIHSIKPG